MKKFKNWYKKQKYAQPFVFVLLFALIGVSILLLTRAAGPSVAVETESATLSGVTQVSDTTASGGSYLKFGSGPSEPPPPPPPGTMPTKQSIKDNAGPNNPSALRASGSIEVTTSGAVIENVDIGNGTINVKASNVTIRNCRVKGYSNVAVIKVVSGFTGLKVEHCRIEAIHSSTGQPTSAVVSGGSGITVRNTEITGSESDGIKAMSNSLYEYNYIHMSKPSGAIIHLDGIQGSGTSNWTARYNVIEMGIENGGNFTIFAQGWLNPNCVRISNIEASNNYIYGGNWSVSFTGGKDQYCSGASSYATNMRMLNNVFAPDPDCKVGNNSGTTVGYRYGFYNHNVAEGVQMSGNKLEDGRAITGGQTPIC